MKKLNFAAGYPYLCLDCYKTFLSAHGYVGHRFQWHNPAGIKRRLRRGTKSVRRARYSCPECPEVPAFSSAITYASHRRYAHPIGEDALGIDALGIDPVASKTIIDGFLERRTAALPTLDGYDERAR